MEFIIRPLWESEREWAIALLRGRWGSAEIVTRGKIHQADALPGLVAECEGERYGLLTYNIESEECELVSLDSLVAGQGVASALLKAVQSEARQAGCKRLGLITTNDNTDAIDFYLRRGFSLAAVHRGAVNHSRRQKPEIPSHNADGIAIEDEWEFEYKL